jgi:carboxyl-terminal processing protease
MAHVPALAIVGWLALAAAATPPQAERDLVVRQAWTTVRDHFYDAELIGRIWEDAWARHMPAAEDDARGDHRSATEIINAMLAELRASHTAHYTADQQEYYELLDLFARAIGERAMAVFPAFVVKYIGIEAFTRQIDGRWFITAVWPGGPADAAGLLAGDEIIAAEGAPFHPIHAFASRSMRPTSLLIRRTAGSEPFAVSVTPREIRPGDAFERSMRESARIIDTPGRKIGYIRPLSYAGQRYHDALVETLSAGVLRDAEALILDLRGGWGGASPDHAEVFVGGAPNMTAISRDGRATSVSFRWRRPFVVLIDEGTRSGKEVLAWSFRRAGVPLVGSRTAGAVVAGRAVLLRDNSLLYFAVADIVVEDERLEGVGVAPTHEVPFDVRYATGADPQLDAAIKLLAGD